MDGKLCCQLFTSVRRGMSRSPLLPGKERNGASSSSESRSFLQTCFLKLYLVDVLIRTL